MDDFFRATNDDSHSFVSEEKIIKQILKSAGSPGVFRHLLEQCKEDTGQNNITLSWFIDRYPSFPIWLGVRKVEFQRDVFGGLLKKFTLTPCFKAWEEVNDSKPEDDERITGCIFTWPQFGVCCIHQYSQSYLSPSEGIWISRKMPSFEERFVIEPFNQLLSVINWQVPNV